MQERLESDQAPGLLPPEPLSQGAEHKEEVAAAMKAEQDFVPRLEPPSRLGNCVGPGQPTGFLNSRDIIGRILAMQEKFPAKDKDDAAEVHGEHGEAPFLAGKRYLLRGEGARGPIVPEGGQRIAVVTTLRDVDNDGQLSTWLEWYRIAGFAHVFLYADDPALDEVAFRQACADYSVEFLSVVLNGAELQEEWPTLLSWQQLGKYTDDRMCRQLLNIAHCVRRCFRACWGSTEGVDWLFHLDFDELFLPPHDGLQALFAHLTRGGCELCLFRNFEAVPEDHSFTPFRDVTLFKVPAGSVPRTPLGARGINYWMKRTKAGPYFLYYDNGKSAVRICRGKSELAPTSVHVLYPQHLMEGLARRKGGWTNFPERELPELQLDWMVSATEDVVASAKVLHYPATHYLQLFRKYNHLKGFPAIRFGGDIVVPPSFHLEARDCYMAHTEAGPEAQKEALRVLLEEAAMLREPKDVEGLQRAGSIVRVEAVRDSLNLGRFVPPRPLGGGGFLGYAQRMVTPEDMARLQGLQTVEAEVLLQDGGGLMQQNVEGLDEIARRLETVGWAAFKLGGRSNFYAKALEEAAGAEVNMTPGDTVIRNEVITDILAHDPRSRRGDKILFMEEHGYTGPEAMKGKTPGLAMLDQTLVDVAMSLDSRLQRGGLRMRITERCDSMLAIYDGGGAAYGPHIDNQDGDGRVDGRVLAVIIYLNQGWDKANGGELAIFQPDVGRLGFDEDVDGMWHLVCPEEDTMVVFRADRTLHEVRPAQARRVALSAWFCGRPADAA